MDPLTLNRYAYVKNSPMNYTDPSGYWLETVLDVGSAIDSAISFIRSPGWMNAGFLLWDFGSIIIPLAPGSYIGKGAKYLGKVDDISDALRSLE